MSRAQLQLPGRASGVLPDGALTISTAYVPRSRYARYTERTIHCDSPLCQHHTPELTETVAQMYAGDIARFGYEFKNFQRKALPPVLTIGHIVNPVIVDPSSDLFVAQPITFETMRRARASSSSEVAVSLYSAQFREDRAIVPADFEPTTDLDRSIRDVVPDMTTRKLPLIGDILLRLHDASDADYFIYTNVDIGLNLEFYARVSETIRAGIDCFAIRRRNISSDFTSIDQIPEMYGAPGTEQRAPDCFVFPRELCTVFQLDEIAIGEPGIARSLLCNLIRYGRRPADDLCNGELTFHIGNDGAWRRHPSRAGRLNVANSLKVVEVLYADADDKERRVSMEPHLDALKRLTHRFRVTG